MGVRYRAVFKEGKLFAEYENGVLTYLAPEYSAPKRSALPMPTVIRDIGEYKSPLDGQIITTRSQHRDHMRAHDVVEVGNEPIGGLSAQASTSNTSTDRELGEAIKRRVEEVQAMPQREYDDQVQKQAFEHAEVASLITATPQE